MTATDLTAIAACYWCEKPIPNEPGTPVVLLHWNRYPREVIEPDTAELTGDQPRRAHRFVWGHIVEEGYAHAACAEEAAQAGRGGLVDHYQYPWGEPDYDALERAAWVDAIVSGTPLDSDDDGDDEHATDDSDDDGDDGIRAIGLCPDQHEEA